VPDALRLTLRKALRFGARLLVAAEQRLATTDVLIAEHRPAVAAAMGAHDMASDPDEAYYRERYLEWLVPELEAAGALGGHILDAGCGPGRILVPVAERTAAAGGHVTGVDYLGEAIATAQRRSDEAGLQNVVLFEADLREWLRTQPDATFDATVFLEVAFVLPHLDEVLREIARTLKPGGLLLASLRTRTFIAQHGVASRSWEVAEAGAFGEAGVLPEMGWQNFHSPDEAQAMLERAGFTDIGLHGVGGASGIGGDPLAALARPGELGADERSRLALVENALDPGAGRYLCARAVRAAL
jgi:ubiquinone/menaquinone biosynthesis C-methylase UbiE